MAPLVARSFQRNVIDDVAPTLPALLDRIDGEKTVPKGFVLDTAGARIDRVEMSLIPVLLGGGIPLLPPPAGRA